MSQAPQTIIDSEPSSPQHSNHSNVFGLIESPYSRLEGNSESSPLIGQFKPDSNDLDANYSYKWDSIKKYFQIRTRYYIPVLSWAPKYKFHSDFKQDVIAGCSVAFLIIPQVLNITQEF